MSLVSGPVWAALALLVVASLPKITQPYDLLRALRLAGVRLPAIFVRLFGAVEAVIGLLGLVSGHPVLLALAALSYLGFAGFVGIALARKTPLSSCGCFGKADSPPTVLHVVIVGGLALCLAVGAFAGGPAIGLLPQLSHDPGTALVTAGFAALSCWFSYLAMTLLPALGARPAAPAITITPESVATLAATRGGPLA